MTSITEIIEKAARQYCKCESDYCSKREHFTAGASFAVKDPDMLQAILQPLAEWIRTFEALERQNGQWVIESQLSDEQIVKAFIADNKQKEDGKKKG